MLKENPKGIKAYIRELKRKGELLSKKNWTFQLTKHLQEEGFEGLGSLQDTERKATAEWLEIRTKFSTGNMDREGFFKAKKEFREKYDDILKQDEEDMGSTDESSAFDTAIRFISEKTEVTGFTKTRIRD